MDPCPLGQEIKKTRRTIPCKSKFVYIENNTKDLITITVQISRIARIVIPVRVGNWKICLCSREIRKFLDRRLVNIIFSWNSKRSAFKEDIRHDGQIFAVNDYTAENSDSDSESFELIDLEKEYKNLYVVLVKYNGKNEKFYETCGEICG